ncbi:MAG: methyltransferase domain-containing protein [Cyanobacteria bacterium SZAS LIN-3]|nr:methyltransferase domain-containing protein [Cyanobacteria bacterium SZAS LIN-3]
MVKKQAKQAAFLLLVGRWHGVTKDQERALRQALKSAGDGKLVFVITAQGQGATKRHPLYADERVQVVEGLARALRRPYEVHTALDINESATDADAWTSHIIEVVKRESAGETLLDASNTVLVSANPDVNKHFARGGYRAVAPSTSGALPVDLLAAIASGRDWRKIATASTRKVYEARGIVERIVELFDDVLVNEEGELSHGRDFTVYSQGMDASLAVKIQDICPHIQPTAGKIVDKGCGTGTLLIHLSNLFPRAEIVGMDLSRELLHMSDSQHYPNHNVTVVKGNIIHKRFADGSVSTAIFSSVMHEVYSYNGYDRDQIRLALTNTREELEERFRKFAREFKGKSAKPGVVYEEQIFDGVAHFRMTLHEANEFLSKKDYVTNWAMEVNEEFGVWTTDEWARELTAIGYRMVACSSYLNPWIEKNRYNGHVWLFADSDGKPGETLPFDDTTGVIVAEKV